MPQDAAVEGRIGEGGMLDQLARVARVEHAVEFLAAAELDGSLQLLGEDDIVGNREIGGPEDRGADPITAVVGGRLGVERERHDSRQGQNGEHDRGAEPGPAPARRGICSVSHGRLPSGNLSHIASVRALRRSGFPRNGPAGTGRVPIAAPALALTSTRLKNRLPRRPGRMYECPGRLTSAREKLP